jgi:hypothetical protein
LTSSSDEIAKIVDGYEAEIQNIRQDRLHMCWHMRGGLTYEESMNLSMNEAEVVAAIVKDNHETAKKTGLPYF